MEIQEDLGSDIMMAFDECAPYPADYDYIKNSMGRTLRWLERCKDYHSDMSRQALFGIVQGGMYPDLREISAKETTKIDLPGYAIGGLCRRAERFNDRTFKSYHTFFAGKQTTISYGVGTPDYLFEMVEAGIDMADCVLQTRIARNGTAITSEGNLVIQSTKFARKIFQPIDKECKICPCLSKLHEGLCEAFDQC